MNGAAPSSLFRTPMNATRLTALVTAMLSTGCGPAVAGSRYLTSASVPASSGGLLTVSASSSAEFAGAELEISPNALAQTTVVTAEPAVGVTFANARSTPMVWGPVGTALSSRARVTVPVSLKADDVEANLIGVVTGTSGDPSSEGLAAITLNATRTLATFRIARLGTVFVRRTGSANDDAGCPAASAGCGVSGTPVDAGDTPPVTGGIDAGPSNGTPSPTSNDGGNSGCSSSSTACDAGR